MFVPIAVMVSFVGGGTPEAHGVATARLTGTMPTYSVGLEKCTFVDRTRSVLRYTTSPPTVLAPHRALITEIRYPTLARSSSSAATTSALPAARIGGFPLILFAHGYDVNPATYAALLDSWASRGFVVAAPLFPDESASGVAVQGGANTEADLVNEPTDITFVTRQMLNDSAVATSNCALLYGLIDSSALALAGHSDGAIAVGMLSYSKGLSPQGAGYSALRSSFHFRATIVMEGDEGGRAPYQTSPTSPALLVIQSAQDHCNPAAGSLHLYRQISQPNKWFFELLRAHHLPPFDGTDRTGFESVSTTTSTFLHMTLDQTATSAQLLRNGNAEPSIAKLFHAGTGPSMPRLTSLYCGLN